MKGKACNDYCPDIWERFQEGDIEAFAIIYNFHIDRLYHYGSKLCKDDELVKDSLQEIFTELFLRKIKINITFDHLKYWLILALKRDLIKKMQKRRKFSDDFHMADEFTTEYSIEHKIIKEEEEAEANRKIVNALNMLSSGQKEAVYLRFNKGLEYSEIAGIMDITVESVRKQVYRALKEVREIIGNESVKIFFTIFIKKGKNICPYFKG